MIKKNVATKPNQANSATFQFIWKTLSAASFSGAILTIIIALFGAPFDIQNQIGFIAICACASLPIFALVNWRQMRLERVNAQLRRLAYYDGMLNCLNRRGFIASVEQKLKSATTLRPCSLLVIDADNFKRINDKFGHIEGDNALHLMTTTIRDAVRSSDVLGRIGGEEFGVLLPGADGERARTIAARIRAAVANVKYMPEAKAYPLSVSIGGAIANQPIRFGDLFAVADKHLFAAKTLGRNRVAFTTPDPTDPEALKNQENAA